MNLNIEEILILIVALLIGWFLNGIINQNLVEGVVIKSNCEDILKRVCQADINGDRDSCKACANRSRIKAKSSARLDPKATDGQNDWPTKPSLNDIGEIKCNEQQSDDYCESIF